MSLGQFLQIFWARRIFIALCTASCLVGAVLVCLIIPPIWAAHGRVLLNGLKPDPVTGELNAGNGYAGTAAFQLTQMNLMTDYSVTGKAVDDLNWLSDPNLINRYAARDKNDHRDFRRFAADLLAAGVKVKPVKDSTILEITYTSASPVQAKAVVEALIRAYVSASLQFRTDDATRTANWYEGELAKMKAKLDDATLAEADYEKQNGIVMANDKLDVESQRLEALAGAGAPLVMPPAMVDAAKSTGMELATVNAQIVSGSKTLGPNNPAMQELLKRKSELTALAAKDDAAARAANSAAASGAGHVDRELNAAKGRVLAKSTQIAHLQTLQQDVDLRRSEYQTAAAKFATFRAEADQTSPNTVTPLGVDTPGSPEFPNWLLIIPGALILGLGVGVLVSLIAEAFNRRVRSVEDLDEGLDLPVIGVIAAPSKGRGESVVRLPRPGAAAPGVIGA
jgi:uncharacterized protein involved in exopolysaccharide biosynthesis